MVSERTRLVVSGQIDAWESVCAASCRGDSDVHRIFRSNLPRAVDHESIRGEKKNDQKLWQFFLSDHGMPAWAATIHVQC